MKKNIWLILTPICLAVAAPLYTWTRESLSLVVFGFALCGWVFALISKFGGRNEHDS